LAVAEGGAIQMAERCAGKACAELLGVRAVVVCGVYADADSDVVWQLILADLALLSRSDTPTIISLVGNMVLYVICGLIGALTVAPYKYMWWVASLIFLIIVFMLLLQRLNNAEGYGGDALKGLTWLTILVWLVYPIVWIVGSEGTGALGLSQEVGIITIADLIAKIGFGFYLLANVDAPEAESAPLNQSSQQYV
jgi:bacteriorhodopsin